jgi:hypothetical protein
MSLHVIVTGGRDYHDYARVFAVLDELNVGDRITRLHEGAARGADTLAWDWHWERFGGGSIRHPARWDLHGKRAGPIRNAEMLAAAIDEAQECGASLLVVAFPGGVGTADMVAKARRAGVEVREVPGV